MAQFVTPLELVLVSEEPPRARWIVAHPLKYISNLAHRGEYIGLIIVPAGFETDLASVPRLPVAWLLAGGVGNAASVVHDYLCRHQLFSSSTADKVFAEALAASGISAWRRGLMYSAVAMFGPSWGSE